MDSGGLTLRSGAALMPTLAILRYEMGSLWSSWLVRLWLIASGLWSLLFVAASWATLPTPTLIAALLMPYLVFPWFVVVMILGISPVTGTRLDALADGILSRPITRHEYLLGSWAARVLTVLIVFLVVVVPCIVLAAFAKRPVASDPATVYGTVASLFLVGLVMTFLVSLGFLAGTLLRRPMVATVMLLFVWWPITGILHTYSLEELSPISLCQAMPTLLRTPWRTPEGTSTTARPEDAEEMARRAAQFLSVLSGGPGPQTSRESPEFFQRGHYEDFSLWRVVLGYLIPTLASIGLATLCFCRRDL